MAIKSGNCTNMTLHSDGKSKHGRSYETFDVINEKGKLHVCGLREVGTADAQSQLDLFCEILDDVCSCLENKNEYNKYKYIRLFTYFNK